MSNEGTLIALHFIESINYKEDSNDEDAVMNKLIDDKQIIVRTTGGFEYTISAKKMLNRYQSSFNQGASHEEVLTDILDRWLHIIKGR